MLGQTQRVKVRRNNRTVAYSLSFWKYFFSEINFILRVKSLCLSKKVILLSRLAREGKNDENNRRMEIKWEVE